MVARFQADVGRGPLGSVSGLGKAVHFCVRPAELLVPPLPHHLTIPDQDTPHHGVGVNCAPPPSTQFDGLSQMLTIFGGKVRIHGNQNVTRKAREPK